MAISAYVGIPRSGKSYEVVSSVIVEQFKKGRRIVTNIEGINEQALIDYCLRDKSVKDGSLGTLIKVTDADCVRDDFFPYKGAEVETICKPGDLICIDEVWRVFPSDNIKPNHRSFIAEHGHFTDPETGLCCDLVVINQSVSGIPRFIKDRIETTYLMSRLLSLGMPNRYRVNVYTGAKVTKAGLVAQYQNKYNKEIFNLYKSFDGLNGKQATIDDRQNFLKSGTFKLMIFAIIAMFSLSYYLLKDLLFSDGQKSDSQSQSVTQTEKFTVKSSDTDKDAQAKALHHVQNLNMADLKLSVELYLCGKYRRNNQDFAIVCQYNGHNSYKTTKRIRNDDGLPYVVINGQKVMDYLDNRFNKTFLNYTQQQSENGG